MQECEQRADEMLRTLGGSLSVQEQRVMLQRMIRAEDEVVRLREEMALLADALETTEALARTAS